jgi:hypothetical protein
MGVSVCKYVLAEKNVIVSGERMTQGLIGLAVMIVFIHKAHMNEVCDVMKRACDFNFTIIN